MPTSDDGLLDDGSLWTVISSSFDDEQLCFAFRYLGKIFSIEAVMDDLSGWSDEEKFQQMLRDASEDYDAEDALYDFVWDHFLLFANNTLRIKRSVSISVSCTLQDFFATEILAFELVSNGTDVQFVPSSRNTMLAEQLLPQMKLDDLVGHTKVRCIDASQLLIQPQFEDSDILSDSPATVTLLSSTVSLHFKPVQDYGSFGREYANLLQIVENSLEKKHRLPIIYGLVTYTDRPDIVMGMLLEQINHCGNMMDRVERHNPSLKLKQTWYDQVEGTVRALHRCNIVWGDVKPDNVLIDHDQNAWIIDFGGGFNSGYVDEDVMESVKGDNQGVSRIKGMLLEGKRY